LGEKASFYRFFFAITLLFLPGRTSSTYYSTLPGGGGQTPCTCEKLRAKKGGFGLTIHSAPLRTGFLLTIFDFMFTILGQQVRMAGMV